jgi:hypothetical protein
MKKITKKEYRRNVINHLIEVFDASKVEFGCLAEIMSVVRDEAKLLAEKAYKDGYIYSSSMYSPVMMMRDIFAHDCAKAIFVRKWPDRFKFTY